jgi:hydroxypyruvate isomerase
MLWTLQGTFEEKLSLAAGAGIPSVGLVAEHHEWSDADAKHYTKLARSQGLAFDTIVGNYDWLRRPVTMLNPAHLEGFLNDVEEALVWAKKLTVPQVIVLAGNVQPGLSREAQHASMVQAGRRAADLAEAAEVTLILEPLNPKIDHEGYFLPDCTAGLAVVKAIDSPRFRLLFDVYHEYVQTDKTIPVIKDCVAFTTMFHVADAPGRHDPGTGEMPWNEIYRTIGELGYSGYVALEYLPAGDQLASLKQAVQQMSKHLSV